MSGFRDVAQGRIDTAGSSEISTDPLSVQASTSG